MSYNKKNKRDYSEIKEYIKSYIDYDGLLTALGFSISKTNSFEIRAPCILHGGDNPYAFRLKRSTGRFYCYTRQCEKSENGEVDNDLIALVRRARNCGFKEALEYLAIFCGISLEELNNDKIKGELGRFRVEKDRRDYVSMMDYLDPGQESSEEFVMNAYNNGAEYFKNLGISDYIVEKYLLGSYVDNYGILRASVPLFDDSGNIVGYSGRAADKKKITKIKYSIKPGVEKDKLLYNLHNCKLNLSENSIIIVVEGFKALWAIVECGHKNVVAIMGSTITEGQINLLIKNCIKTVILFLDWNTAGIEGSEKTKKVLNEFGIEVRIIDPINELIEKGKTQPDDLEKNDLSDLIDLYMY
jgi:DNA primase